MYNIFMLFANEKTFPEKNFELNLNSNFVSNFITHQFNSTPKHANGFKSFNTPDLTNHQQRNFMNSDEKRGVERFRRVKEEAVQIDHRVKDNSFEAKVCVLAIEFLIFSMGQICNMKMY